MVKQFIQQFLVKNKPIIGLDIGKSEIKMVLLEGKALGNAVFKAYATQSILIEKKKDKDGPLDKQEIDPAMEEIDRIAKAITKCWKKLDTPVKDVAISIPSSSMIAKKTIIGNYDTKQELEEAMNEEMANTMPFTLDEVNLDFQVMGPNVDSPTENDAIIWATKKEKVEAAVAIVEAAGLNPVILDIENYAIYNALTFIEDKIMPNSDEPITDSSVDVDLNNQTGKPVVKKNISIVIDLGYAFTKMLVYKNAENIYSRENDVSLQQLNQQIMSRFSYESISEVEKFKKSQQLPIEYKLEILPEFLNTYVSDIARGIGFFFSSSATNPSAIKGIYLTGGGASLEGLIPALKKALDEEALKEKIFLLSIPFYMQKNDKLSLSVLQKDEYSLTLACGLALRKFLKKEV